MAMIFSEMTDKILSKMQSTYWPGTPIPLMTPSGMANRIYAEMEATYWPGTSLPQEAESETKKYYETISRAIIDYLKENAEVETRKYYENLSKAIIEYIKENAEVPSGISVSTPDMYNGSTTTPGKVV